MRGVELIKVGEVFVCDCHSMDHQLRFWHGKEEYNGKEFDELRVTVHLTTHDNFFKRLWAGLKYAFGYMFILLPTFPGSFSSGVFPVIL